jgi:hypothetical protein
MTYTKTGGKRILATPDAIHFATALTLTDTYKVPLDGFHTFDAGKGKGGVDGPEDLSGAVSEIETLVERAVA